MRSPTWGGEIAFTALATPGLVFVPGDPAPPGETRVRPCERWAAPRRVRPSLFPTVSPLPGTVAGCRNALGDAATLGVCVDVFGAEAHELSELVVRDIAAILDALDESDRDAES